MMIRSFFVGLLFLSPFFFPFVCTFLGIAIAALFIPSAALFTGVLIDLLYSSSLHIPIGTLSALMLVGIGYLVRTLLRTHIMSA